MSENNNPFYVPLVSYRSVKKIGSSTPSLTVQDEGVDISTTCDTINFIGSDVQVLSGGANIVRVYIPTPTFASHWNTSDGTTNASVNESGISSSSARISEPTSVGNPFSVGSFGNTNQNATLNSSSSYSTSGLITGFGTGSNFEIKLIDADGISSLETYNTGAITSDGTFTSGSGFIVATVTNYQTDTTRFKANISIAIAFGSILTANSRVGGKINVYIVMTSGDGTGTYSYTSSPVFYDTNPSTPSVSGTVTIAETFGQVQTKHLSGVEYYIVGSQFTIAITGIDNLNQNTARTTSNLQVSTNGYQTSTLNNSPFGTNSANFSGWTIAYNNTGTAYNQTDYAISSSNQRFRGTNAYLQARGRDTWGNGSYIQSSNASILVDTYGTTSGDLFEGFTDENRRQTSNWNTGSTSGNWNSTNSVIIGEAIVFNGQLMSPQSMTLTTGATQTNLSTFLPNLSGANPNYTGLTVPVSYYRTIVDTTGFERSSFTIVFTGNFVSNATTDLANSNLEIYISRRASTGGGNSGYNNTDLLLLHGATYNFATFDDGVTDGHIREGSSSGNTVNATFGGFSCEDGFFMHIKIINSSIRISSLSVTFF